MAPIEKLRVTKKLRNMCTHYLQHANRTQHLGFILDTKEDSRLQKEYLLKLRELQKAKAYIVRSTRLELKEALDSNNSALFKHLTSANLDGVLEPLSFKKEVLLFKQKKSAVSPIALTKPVITSPAELKANVPEPIVITPVIKAKISNKEPLHVKPNIEYLGNSFDTSYPNYKNTSNNYIKNIWDMQLYNNTLYLGLGDNSDNTPLQNIHILQYNEDNNSFYKDIKSSEKKITNFRILNNKLYALSAKKTVKSHYASYYKRSIYTPFKKYKSLLSAKEFYDIARYDDELITAINQHNKTAIIYSENCGKSWSILSQSNASTPIFSFLQVDDSLYTSKLFATIEERKSWSKEDNFNYATMSEFTMNREFISRNDLNEKIMFPNTHLNATKNKKIIQSHPIGSKAIYIGAYANKNEEDENFGVYIASSLEYDEEEVERVTLPYSLRIMDILVKSKSVYILGYDSTNKAITVFGAQQKNLSNFKELLNFPSENFARSFEKVGSYFYFALGCNIEDKDDKCGSLIRVDTKKPSIIAHQEQ